MGRSFKSEPGHYVGMRAAVCVEDAEFGWNGVTDLHCADGSIRTVVGNHEDKRDGAVLVLELTDKECTCEDSYCSVSIWEVVE